MIPPPVETVTGSPLNLVELSEVHPEMLLEQVRQRSFLSFPHRSAILIRPIAVLGVPDHRPLNDAILRRDLFEIFHLETLGIANDDRT